MFDQVKTKWTVALVLVLLIMGCSRVPQAPVPYTATPKVITVITTATFTPTATIVATPTPVAFPPDIYRDWLTYTNTVYKFSFQYPPDWKYQEIQGAVNTMSGHAVYLGPRSSSLFRMVVAFKRSNENRQITRTSIGSGEIVTRGSVMFLGQPVRRDLLVLAGKDLAILYHGSGEILRGDLVFTLSLDYMGKPTDPVGLTQPLETTGDMIVASFEPAR